MVPLFSELIFFIRLLKITSRGYLIEKVLIVTVKNVLGLKSILLLDLCGYWNWNQKRQVNEVTFLNLY